MRNLKYVSTFTDVGGAVPEKRKTGDAKTGEPRPKRSRLRLHRTNVPKRVRKMAARVRNMKGDYLDKCPYRYVGLIIDEGNNFRRSCPLYGYCSGHLPDARKIRSLWADLAQIRSNLLHFTGFV